MDFTKTEISYKGKKLAVDVTVLRQYQHYVNTISDNNIDYLLFAYDIDIDSENFELQLTNAFKEETEARKNINTALNKLEGEGDFA